LYKAAVYKFFEKRKQLQVIVLKIKKSKLYIVVIAKKEK